LNLRIETIFRRKERNDEFLVCERAGFYCGGE
jgi:hypothetical protein